MFDHILVICVGNICRSPMAEALLQAEFPDKSIISAGLGALVGKQAHPEAMALMWSRGLDISAHRARQLDDTLLDDSDLVLVMERGHLERIESVWPAARGRAYRWGHWSGFDVPDPYGCREGAFRTALGLIDRGLGEWKRQL